MALADETALLNEFDCPLFSLAQTILYLQQSPSSMNVIKHVRLWKEMCSSHIKRRNRNVKGCFGT